MNQPTGRFQIGARVRERRSSRYGTIIETLPADQIRVVFDSGSTAIVRGIELEMATPPAGFVSQQQFLADLVSFKLSQPLSDTLYSYQSSRTHFEAYQFKPAIKLLSNADPVLLIADEVGLGKTIEAAIIYLELKARMRDSLRRVLVVCPASLQEK